MIIEISVAIIALAFVCLVIYLIATLRSVRVTLGQLNITLSQVRQEAAGITEEAKKAIMHTNLIGADIQKKIESFNPLFRSFNYLGEIVEKKVSHFKQEVHPEHGTTHESVANSLASSETNESKKKTVAKHLVIVGEVIEMIGLGIHLWQKLKKRR